VCCCSLGIEQNRLQRELRQTIAFDASIQVPAKDIAVFSVFFTEVWKLVDYVMSPVSGTLVMPFVLCYSVLYKCRMLMTLCN